MSTYDDGLQGLRVLVTAGGSGIGLAIAEHLLARGARVGVCDVDDDALAQWNTRQPKAAFAVHADVSSEADVDALFEQVRSQLGGLDALVNNAGISGPSSPVEDLSLQDWQRCIDVNLTGQFLCTRRAVPLLKTNGGGSIVNLSSGAGRMGFAYRSPYSSSKFGVICFTQSLAKELGPAGIRVNAILPGPVEGERIQRVFRARAQTLGVSPEEVQKQFVQNVSLRRMVTADDIAAAAVFLLSRAGANISGQSLSVDGNLETV